MYELCFREKSFVNTANHSLKATQQGKLMLSLTNRWLFRSLSSAFRRRLSAYGENVLISWRRRENSSNETWRRFVRFVYSSDFHGKYLDTKEFKLYENFFCSLGRKILSMIRSRDCWNSISMNVSNENASWNINLKFFFPVAFLHSTHAKNRTLQQVKLCAPLGIAFHLKLFDITLIFLFGERFSRSFGSLIYYTSNISLILLTQNLPDWFILQHFFITRESNDLYVYVCIRVRLVALHIHNRHVVPWEQILIGDLLWLPPISTDRLTICIQPSESINQK